MAAANAEPDLRFAGAGESMPALLRARERLIEAQNLRRAGDIGQAQEICAALIRHRPDYVAALRLLGLLCAERGDNLNAATHLGRAVLLNPFDWTACVALARSYLELDCVEMAIRAVQEALALAPAEPEIQALLGDAYRRDREYELSVECYRQALAAAPRSVDAAHGLARSLIQLGRLDEAAATLDRLIADGCRDADALFTLCRLPAALIRIDLLGLLDRGLQFRKQADGNRVAFLRAAALHRLGRHEECWACLIEANRGVFARVSDSYREGAQGRAAALRRLAAAPARREGGADGVGDRPRPLFILGPPRSGKSTLEELLGRTPGVRRGFESAIVGQATQRAFQNAGFPTHDRLDDLPADLGQEFRTVFRDELGRRAADARIFTMTAYGALRAAEPLARLVPEARFVFVRRDLDDHVFSLFFQHYGLAMNYAYDLATIREFIGWYNAMGEAFAAMYPSAVRVLAYEAIVTRPAEAVAAVGELCGFDFAASPSSPIANDIGCASPYLRWLQVS